MRLETVRYLLDRFALLPAADYLPQVIVLRMAALCGWGEALFTGRGRMARREITVTHGLTGLHLLAAAAHRCSIPYSDLVMIRRVAKYRTDPTTTGVHHQNGEAVRQLMSAQQPFLIGVAHSTYYSGVLLAAHCHAVGFGALPAPIGGNDTQSRRFRLRQDNFESALSRAGCVIVPLQHDTTGAAAGARAMVDTLKRGPVIMAVDPPWSIGRAYTRPFCGAAQWPFPYGAVRLARVSRKPLVGAFSIVNDDGSLTLAWSDPVSLSGDVSEEEFNAALDTVIDHLERCAGNHRTQFNFETGTDRRWNATAQRWEPRHSSS